VHVIEANMKISESKDLENYLCPENWKLVHLVSLGSSFAIAAGTTASTST
jgi:hypothetical protein